MNSQTAPTELTDLFSTAELIFGAGLLALFMGIAAMLTGRNSAAVAGIAAAMTGIVTIAVGMVWSVVESFDDIISIWLPGDTASDVPVLGLVSFVIITAPVLAVCMLLLVFAIAIAVSVAGRRIRGDQPTEAVN